MSATVLITGANRGIGLALTHACLRREDTVIACCRDPRHARQLHLLTEVYPALTIHSLDVTRPEDYLQLKEQLGDRPLDWLIANAGIMGPQPQGFGHTDYAAWQQVFAVNAMAPLQLAETFVDNLRAGEGKSVACLSSIMASMSENHSGGYYLYRSSKAALNAVVRSLAIDLAPEGIKIFALHPGWVKTDMGSREAPLEVDDAAATLLLTLEKLGAGHSGKFISYDGQQLPW